MIEKKRGLVITGGLAPEKQWFEFLRGRFHTIIAADSGLQTAMGLGVRVDRVVGDMDSLDDRSLLERFPPEAIQVYDTEKDYTDTEIGLQTLEEMGCTSSGIYGGGGGRLDHLFAIFALFERASPPLLWVSDSSVVVLIESRFGLHGMKDRTVSFFPIGSDVCTMKSRGLKWELEGLEWKRGASGVSNIVNSDVLEIEMISGRLIYIGPLDTLQGFVW